MLNAVVTEKDKTVILEFPMDYFQLFKKLGNAGINIPPGRIHLSDNEDDNIRVKLYSDNDFGDHLIRLFKERDTLEDVQTAVTAIEIAPDAVKEELEEYVLSDQLAGTGHLYRTIQELKEAYAPVVTTFYCPLLGRIYDSEYGEETEVGNEFLKASKYEIKEMLEQEQPPDLDMSEYITDHLKANEKLVSAVWSVEEIDGTLYGRIDCHSTEAFTEEETEALKEGIAGQNSDGFGEGFEQKEIKTEEGDLYVSFWNSSDNYFIRTKEEMNESPGFEMQIGEIK